MTRRRPSSALDAAIARFRLYPEARRGLYVRVLVFATSAELRAACREWGDRRWRRTAGMCAAYDRFRIYGRSDPRKPRRLLEFATVFLSRDNLTMRIVSHELAHASVAWAKRVGLDFKKLVRTSAGVDASSEEERFVSVFGVLCSDFVERAHGFGLYDP